MSRKHSERKESLAISKGCKRTLQQFSQLTTLHGYKNVVEPNRHYMERYTNKPILYRNMICIFSQKILIN